MSSLKKETGCRLAPLKSVRATHSLSEHGSISALVVATVHTTLGVRAFGGCRFETFDRALSKHHRVTTKVEHEATLSTQILLDINVRFAMSLCIGSICGGAQVVGAWQAAKGIDLALTNSTDWKLRSELTSYAEYPESDSMSHAAPRRCCTSLRRP